MGGGPIFQILSRSHQATRLASRMSLLIAKAKDRESRRFQRES